MITTVRLPTPRPTRNDRLYTALGWWHTLAFSGFMLAPIFMPGMPWYLIFRHLAGTAISPPLLVVFVVPVTLFVLRFVRTRRRREAMLDPDYRAERPRGLVAGRVCLALGSAGWLAAVVAAIVPLWRAGIGLGVGIGVLLSGIGILTIEVSARRWEREGEVTP
jgi:hypothetical protein